MGGPARGRRSLVVSFEQIVSRIGLPEIIVKALNPIVSQESKGNVYGDMDIACHAP